MDCIDHGVAKSLTRLSDFHFHTFTCTARAVSSAPSALELISNKLKLVFHGVGGRKGDNDYESPTSNASKFHILSQQWLDVRERRG